MPEIPGDTTTTSTISLGQSVFGTLETTGDHDWFAISLTAGQQIVITLGGYGTSQLSDTYLYLRDSAGNLIVSNDDGGPGTDSQIIFTVPTTGIYYIDVGAYANSGTGDYQLVAYVDGQPPVYTNDQIADQLVNGYWNDSGNVWHAWNVGADGSISVNITALTAEGQALARAALAAWGGIIGVTFVEVSTGGEIVFDDADQSGAYANSSWTGNTLTSASINIPTDWINYYGTTLDSYSYQTYLHEIGHALGLGHGGNYNGGGVTYDNNAIYANDAWSTTLMSYFSQTENSYFANQGFTYNYALTPMMGDIAAMQMLYGLSTSTRSGNTVYGNGSTADNPIYNATAYPDAAVTIFDTGGIDTLNYSGFSTNQRINLNAGTFSNVASGVGNLAIAVGVVIENATTGSGNDTLIGNAVNNVLDGGAGTDTASYETAAARVVVSLAIAGAQNTVGAGSDTLVGIENLTGSAYNDRLTGNTGVNVLVGLAGADVIVGGGGNDVLDGGAGNDWLNGALGNDSMIGGAGNDIYYVNAAGDTTTENANEGVDTVRSAISWTLGANIESLLLLGTGNINGTGNALNNVITGNSGANSLSGGGGNDRLNGGAGNDSMAGGAGNDIYVVDSLGDTVTENLSEGVDTVQSSISWTLGANVESLQLIGTANINGTGNAGANLIRGNSGANVLAGAAGNDTIRGGLGNDTLEGGVGRDVLYGDGGADTFAFRNGDFAGLTATTSDKIVDFSQAQADKINLALVDANELLTGDQAFNFIGTGAFSNVAGQLRYEVVSGNTYVYGDTDGDGTADFMILLTGTHALTGGDFVI